MIDTDATVASETHRVQTPEGLSEVSVVHLALNVVLTAAVPGRHGDFRGNRAILRSRVTGREDLFAVFSQSNGMRGWNLITETLTAAQVQNWEDFPRRPHGVSAGMHPTFDIWLNSVRDTIAGDPRYHGADCVCTSCEAITHMTAPCPRCLVDRECVVQESPTGGHLVADCDHCGEHFALTLPSYPPSHQAQRAN